MLEFEKEELEVKNETLEKAKIDMDDSIEEVYTKNRELLKLNENLVNESVRMKIEVEEARKEFDKKDLKTSKKTKLLEASNKDLEERMMMSENVIKSRDLDIIELKKNCFAGEKSDNFDKVVKRNKEEEYFSSVMKTFQSFTQRNDHRCEECDFDARTSEVLKMHMQEKHEVQCEDCSEKFKGLNRLKNHMCRLYIGNPSCGDFYVKNWMIKNECVRVFSENLKREIAIIHSEVCLDKHSCTYVLPEFISQPRYIDNSGFIHLHSSELIIDRNVKWAILTEMVEQ